MLTEKCKQFCQIYHLFSPEQRILLTVSGGADSSVMAILFQHLGLNFGIAHCNFRLRGGESDADAQFVRQMALDFNVPFYEASFTTADYAREKGISIQMAARELRYEWFEQIRRENHFDLIATAHHLDDQAETFLINLLRGTGIKGLHGIPLRQGYIIRPMMFATRLEILEYARQHRIPFREDQSNADPKYIRNKIRNEIMPLFREMNPGFLSGLTDTIRQFKGMEKIAVETMERWRSDAGEFEGSKVIYDIRKIIDSGHSETFLWYLLSEFGFTSGQVGQLLQSLPNQEEKVFLSESYRLIKERDRLVVERIKTEPDEKEYEIHSHEIPGRVHFPLHLDFILTENPGGGSIHNPPGRATIDAGKLDFPLIVRHWRPGDRFIPFGMQGSKKVSDFFTELKMSSEDKKNTWLLVSRGKIAWIIGRRIDNRFRVNDKTRRILTITYNEAP